MTRVSSAKIFVKKNLFRKSICRIRFLRFLLGIWTLTSSQPFSTPTDSTIPASIDRHSCYRLTHIPESSSCPQNIADSTQERTDESDVDRVTLEDFLELEEWLRQKLDDDRHLPDCIDRHTCLDKLPGYTVEMEPIEERVYKSETSHLSVPKHQRPCEAVGIHKKVKRIHDPVKFVVPRFVFEDESPIPPDRSVQPGSYIGVLDDHQHALVSQSGLRYRGYFDKGPT